MSAVNVAFLDFAICEHKARCVPKNCLQMFGAFLETRHSNGWAMFSVCASGLRYLVPCSNNAD